MIFQVAMLPSVIVGESAGMLKFCAASEAWPGWKAAIWSIVSFEIPVHTIAHLSERHGCEVAVSQRVPTPYKPQRLKPSSPIGGEERSRCRGCSRDSRSQDVEMLSSELSFGGDPELGPAILTFSKSDRCTRTRTSIVALHLYFSRMHPPQIAII